MKKTIIISFVLMLLIVTIDPSVYHANALLRIAGGSVAEKAVIGLAEKAGLKYAEKTAQETAVKRWNLDLINQYNVEQAENKVLYENLVQRLNNPTPIPEKPGFGKVVLDGVLFATGLDILWDGYQAFKNAANGEVEVDDTSAGVQYSNRFGDFRLYIRESDEVYNYWTLVQDNTVYGTYVWMSRKQISKSSKCYIVPSAEYNDILYVVEKMESGYQKVIYTQEHIENRDNSVTTEPFITAMPVPAFDVSSAYIDWLNSNGNIDKTKVPDEVEIIVPLETDYEVGTNPVIEPVPEIPPVIEPVPKYIPNPNFNPDLAPAADNPRYIPNPNYDPENPLANDPTAEPDFDPIGDIPPVGETSLNFEPLIGAIGDIKKKFPFSIPWDLAAQLSIFDVEPQAPKITLDFSAFPYAKATTQYELSLEFFNPLAVAARWFLTIAIDIAFILMLRRLLPE